MSYCIMNNKMNMREMIDEMNKLSQLLKESYIFDGAKEEAPMEEPMPEDMMGAEENMPISQTEDKVNQIRTLALDGIQEYAEQVDSEEYQFFKKVWMMCDKVCSEKEKVSDGE